MTYDCDVLVLGGNPGGCAAAVTAARSGASVILLEPTATLGGNNANGVFAFDTADPVGLSGIATEVCDLIDAHYAAQPEPDPVRQAREDPVWESHVNAAAWRALTDATDGLQALTGAVPVAATAGNGRVVSVSWQRAVTPAGDPPGADTAADVFEIRPRFVIDASYEGDLLEWLNVPYRIGREPRSPQEPHAGRVYTTDTALGPGGVLPHSVLPHSTGEGDDAVMAFACRLHCRWYDDTSPDAPHRIREPSPHYDPSRFRWSPQGVDADGNPRWFGGIYLLAGGKVLVNRTVAGNELAGPTRDYILAHPRDRRVQRDKFITHALDFLYYIQTAGGCPGLGLADDEFADNGHLPYRLYVREGRRLRADVTLTESDVSPFLTGDGTRPPLRPDSVAIGNWPVESRACADRLEHDYPMPEGWYFGSVTRAPHQVPYACMVPPGLDNLLVCGSVSATHLAFGAVRVESTRINLGMAAAVAADEALRRGVPAAAVDVPVVQERLIAQGTPATFFCDVTAADGELFTAVQRLALRGWVPRDTEWRFQPDRPVTWAELADVLTAVLPVPRSVTGVHFAKVPTTHPAFTALESLYDLGTRAGVDLFGLAELHRERAVPDLLNPRSGTPLLPHDPDDPVPAEAGLRLAVAVHSLTVAPVADAPRSSRTPPPRSSRTPPLTRGLLAGELDALSDRTQKAQKGQKDQKDQREPK
ncbi:FAD-dependent oxidoreductase [Streptomyces sp. NPDC004838]